MKNQFWKPPEWNWKSLQIDYGRNKKFTIIDFKLPANYYPIFKIKQLIWEMNYEM